MSHSSVYKLVQALIYFANKRLRNNFGLPIFQMKWFAIFELNGMNTFQQNFPKGCLA